ncbi:MAG: energy transducer TonB, partial [Bacteroidetes bacterium]|nr:energy transducer TonB [Bacteroidota bacterium]
ALANGKPTTGTSEFEIKYNPKTFLKLTKRRGYKHIVLPHTPVDSSGIIYTPKQTNAPPTPILDPQYSSILDFIYSKLKYPEAASKLGLTGDVEIMFVVETNGLPSNIVAIRTLGGGCTEEAVGIIETMKWYPGIINNEAVRTSYNITITFKKSDGKDGHIPNQQGTGI